MIITLGFLSKTPAQAFNSSFEYTEPVGLHGVEKIINFVFGVIAFSNSPAVTLKSFSIPAEITTGIPSATFTISK